MGTPSTMSQPAASAQFRFSIAFPIHYDHIDAQRHLNNVAYFLFMQQARLAYLQEVGLWHGDSFDSIGMILLESSCTFRMPAQYGETVTVWTRISRLGNKSFDFEYRLVTERGEIAVGRSVQVCYDYEKQRSLPMLTAWREAILAFEPALGAGTSP